MKTQAKEKIEKAQELFNLISEMKILEERSKALKEYFKDAIESGVLEAGNVIIVVEDRQRTNIDKKLLEKDLGDISKYETVTEFKQVSVKKVA
jgi:vacuolar-type H+-ATPase subunit I/STV1